MYTVKFGQLIKLPKVIEITGNSRSKIYADVKEGIFPAPLKTGKRAIAWKLSEIEGWVDSLQTNLVKNGGQNDSK
ncbi:MAG: AlpA family phage regulatory protein [Betaproteobacteria bacterium]|jgi:prophage regulatory protein|nr:AlpA family phage regulatory protein [Betaproteobacteria bacterium]